MVRYLVAYDIKDHKRRNKLFLLLKGYGYNIQRSVFEIPTEDIKLIEKLKIEIENLINEKEDLVYIFPFYNEPITNRGYENFFKREISL